ncbi:MAG: hypothetical protein IJH78_03175 [Clostridia bacterium]|nr:hypothetical protein [Clostridia bacterium]
MSFPVSIVNLIARAATIGAVIYSLYRLIRFIILRLGKGSRRTEGSPEGDHGERMPEDLPHDASPGLRSEALSHDPGPGLRSEALSHDPGPGLHSEALSHGPGPGLHPRTPSPDCAVSESDLSAIAYRGGYRDPRTEEVAVNGREVMIRFRPEGSLSTYEAYMTFVLRGREFAQYSIQSNSPDPELPRQTADRIQYELQMHAGLI